MEAGTPAATAALTPQEHQSLYVLGKNITSCTYDPLPSHVSPHLRDLVTAMLQPAPSSRPTIGQVSGLLLPPLRQLQSRRDRGVCACAP